MDRSEREVSSSLVTEGSLDGHTPSNDTNTDAVLLEVGGIGAAVSEESMRKLKYGLQWLQVNGVVYFVSV
jgi:hypothetical protein